LELRFWYDNQSGKISVSLLGNGCDGLSRSGNYTNALNNKDSSKSWRIGAS